VKGEVLKPTDNAFVESFCGKFRTECLNANWFLSLDEARAKCEAPRLQACITIPICMLPKEMAFLIGVRSRGVPWVTPRTLDDCQAAVVARLSRLNIQGPSGRGRVAPISPALTANRKVLDETWRRRAATLRLSHGSILLSADLYTGMRRWERRAVTRSRVQRFTATSQQPVPVGKASDQIVADDQYQSHGPQFGRWRNP